MAYWLMQLSKSALSSWPIGAIVLVAKVSRCAFDPWCPCRERIHHKWLLLLKGCQTCQQFCQQGTLQHLSWQKSVLHAQAHQLIVLCHVPGKCSGKKWPISSNFCLVASVKGNWKETKQAKSTTNSFSSFSHNILFLMCACAPPSASAAVSLHNAFWWEQASFKGSTSFRRSAGRNLSLRKRKGLYMSWPFYGLAVYETSLCEAANPRLSMLPKGYSVCIPLRFSALTEWNAKSLLKSLQSAVSGLSHYEVTAYQHIASANLAQRLISTSGGQKHVHSLWGSNHSASSNVQ